MPRLIGSSATLTPAFGADVLAVAVALETAAAQRDAEDVADVPERLRPFVVRRSTGEGILGVTEAAERLDVGPNPTKVPIPPQVS